MGSGNFYGYNVMSLLCRRSLRKLIVLSMSVVHCVSARVMGSNIVCLH